MSKRVLRAAGELRKEVDRLTREHNEARAQRDRAIYALRQSLTSGAAESLIAWSMHSNWTPPPKLEGKP